MIEFVRITRKADPLLKKMQRTYTDAFPYQERRDLPEVEELTENNALTTVYAIFHDEKYA